jgi:hypothetical protein
MIGQGIILYDRKVKGTRDGCAAGDLAGKQSGVSHEHTLNAKKLAPRSSLAPKGDIVERK